MYGSSRPKALSYVLSVTIGGREEKFLQLEGDYSVGLEINGGKTL